MKHPAMLTGVAATLLITAVVPAAFAQSSGNFAAVLRTEQCTINTMTGELDPSENGGTLLSTTIKTPNDNKTTLLVIPSLLTGLFTNTYIDAMEPTSRTSAAVKVMVTLDGKPVPPATEANPEITYDQRFQQIHTDMWTQIEECEENPECNFEMILSTLAAHTFTFVETNVGAGVHDLEVSWRFECDEDGDGNPDGCSNTFMPNTAAACVGPGTVSVQQVKAFSQSGGIAIN